MIRRLATVTLLLALCPLASAPESRSRPAASDYSDIFMVNADGSGRRNLTKTNTLEEQSPALSPNGRTLAFSRLRVESGYGWWSVAVMPSRGGPPREVIRFPNTSAYGPTWSPDGRLTAFTAFGDEAVGVAGPDGLTWIPNAGSPMWLGNGRLAFLTDFSDAGALAIAVANADGSDRRVIVRGTDVGLMLIGATSASPNGRTIAFTAIDGRQNFTRIYSVNVAAGSRPRLMSGYHGEVSWSPTGRHLVLASSGGPLSTVRADGTLRRYFPATRRLYPQGPSWSPDGTRIAFIAYHSRSRHDLVVMNVRHRSLRVVARRVERRSPVWSRNGRRLYYVAPSGS